MSAGGPGEGDGRASDGVPEGDAGPPERPVVLWANARLLPMNRGDGWDLIPDGALVTRGEHILYAGAAADVPEELALDETRDLGGMLVTPGLIDCHTHLVYGGDRAKEYGMRLEGASYEEIARAGGGIRSTVAATRAATQETLVERAVERALALMAGGVTTLEIKSGYGLRLEDERRCLQAARVVGEVLPLAVQTTCLAAHALPPEYDGDAEGYIDAVCGWLGELHAEGLVDAVDAFCEGVGFDVAQTRRVFEAAQALGLPVRLHAEQLSNLGGAAMAARLGARSCDHLEYLDEEGVQAMAKADTVAVLLPGAWYVLRESRKPPVEALRRAGVAMAVSTDHNPGTSPALSLLMMGHMACASFGLTPHEAVRGMTVHAARALGLADRGRLAEGLRADFAVWELERPEELVYWFGSSPLARLVIGGEEL